MPKLLEKGVFFSLEGGEGAGKSSAAKALKEALEDRGYSVLLTREPGGTPLGEKIRHLLLQDEATGCKPFPMPELLLFLAARAQLIAQVIAPALKEGKVVISDRFHDSTVVYQGIARGLGEVLVEDLGKTVCGAIMPNCTYLFDIDPKVGLQRATAISGKADRIESEEMTFHNRVRQGFCAQAAKYPERFFVLNASLPKEQVASLLIQEVLTYLSQVTS